MPAAPIVATERSHQSGDRAASVLKRSASSTWRRRRDPQLRKQISLATAFAAALGAFLHVVEDYLDNDPIVRWDVEFSRWLHMHASGGLTSAFDVVTVAGNVATLAVVTLVVALLLLRRRAVNEAALLAFGALGIELLNGALKLLFRRPRPELAYVHLDTYSFPSGHTAGSAAVYGLILYLFAARPGLSGRARLGVAVGYVALVAVIGFSRLYLEVHYLSDVLAGAALGAAWAAGLLFVFEWRTDLDVRRVLPGPVRRLLDWIGRSG